MMERAADLDHGRKSLFILSDAQSEFSQQRELLGEKESGGRGKLKLV
jgi:hypothetical protein